MQRKRPEKHSASISPGDYQDRTETAGKDQSEKTQRTIQPAKCRAALEPRGVLRQVLRVLAQSPIFLIRNNEVLGWLRDAILSGIPDRVSLH